MIMRRIWDTAIINSITVFTVLAMIASFSTVSGYFKTTISTVDRQNELIEAVQHSLDKAAEPALFTKSDENRLPDLRMNFLRNFTFPELVCDDSNLYFSHFIVSLKNNPPNYNIPIIIKFLI